MTYVKKLHLREGLTFAEQCMITLVNIDTSTVPGKSRHQFYPHFIKDVTQYVHFTAIAISSSVFTYSVVAYMMEYP